MCGVWRLKGVGDGTYTSLVIASNELHGAVIHTGSLGISETLTSRFAANQYPFTSPWFFSLTSFSSRYLSLGEDAVPDHCRRLHSKPKIFRS
jgi:hypothetical protein